MEKGRVSVLVATYNRADYVEECIDSILGQTVPPLEVIVIDDGSDDDTADRLAKYGHRILCLRKGNGGKASALNMALPLARGEYIWIFDDDDVALPHSIEMRAAVLDRRPELGLIYTGHYMGESGPDGRIRRNRRYLPPDVAETDILPSLLKGCYFTLPGALVRRSAYAAVGHFDPELVTSEDYDMMIRIAARFPCAALAEPSFIVRVHRGLRGPRGSRYREEDRVITFRQYDRMVGERIRGALGLDQYRESLMDGVEGKHSRVRMLLLNRMLVMASKGLLTAMLEDARLALLTDPDLPFSPLERQICRNALLTGYASDALMNDWEGFMQGIEALSPFSNRRAILSEFAWACFRWAKSYGGSFRERKRRLGMATRLAWTAFMGASP